MRWKALKVAVGAGKSLNFGANFIQSGSQVPKRSKDRKAFRIKN